MRKVNN